MKIGVLGIGALGSFFGGSLEIINADVSLILRNVQKKSLIKKKGLIINTNNNKRVVYPKVFLVDELNFNFDVILLLTKTTDSIEALNSIKHVIDTKTILMSIQNGLDNDLILENYVPTKNIIYGTTMTAADLITPNMVSSFGNNYTQFKPKNIFSLSIAKKISQLFNKVGIDTKILDDIDKSIWEKVAFNSAINSSCALLNCTPNFFNSRLYLKRFILKVAEESCNIGYSNGIKINKNEIIRKINISFQEHGNHEPSMLRDVQQKKITEIDSINGALVKYGNLSGVKTTLNYSLLKLIKAKEMSY